MSAETTSNATTPQLDIRNGKATICLNRPAQHNRLEPVDLRELTRMFDELGRDPEVRVLIITASGKSFSSGFHIGALADDPEAAKDYDPDAFEKMVNALETMPTPTIASLNGGTYGGATDLALACDFRIGVEGMRMFMPAARLGIVYYQSGLRRYVTRLGLNAAKRLFLTAETLEADELLQIGFLTELVPANELEARTDALASQIAANAPLAVAGNKLGLTAIACGTFDPDAHAAIRKRSAESEDHKEAVTAWAEKRRPVFKGR